MVEIDMYSVYIYIYICTHLTQKCLIHCGNCNVCFFVYRRSIVHLLIICLTMNEKVTIFPGGKNERV